MVSLRRRFLVEDLAKIPMVSNPQLSPDGESLAYVVTRILDDSYIPTLYVVNTKDGKPRFFIEKSKNPLWSPEGSTLAFVSDRDIRDGETGAELWLSTLVGEARLLCKASGGVEVPCWSGDGTRIFFMSYIGEEDKEVRIFDRVPFWFDAVGWTHYKRKHLFYVDVESGVVSQVTEGDVNLVCHSPSNNGTKIAYGVAENELEPREITLYVRDLETGNCLKILDKYSIASLTWFTDDEFLIFMGNDLGHGYPTHTTVWAISPLGGEPTNLTGKLDRGSSRNFYNMFRSPYAGSANPVCHGELIVFPISDGGRFCLYTVSPLDGEIKPLIEGEFCVEEYSSHNGVVAYTKTSIAQLMEVYIRKNGKDTKLTRLSDAAMAEAPLIDGERFCYEASDGATIEGWALKPYGWEEGEKYPVIFDIHGGPRSKFGHAPMLDHQIWAAEGYGVIYANIRGSDGYDQEFADIRFHYGTRDYLDFMEAVDHALKIHSWIDETRMAVTGLSYGGFMTNWVIGHTGRFRCAVSQNSISNWISFFGTSDIGFHFGPDQIGGEPWSNPAAYAEKSPLTYAANVTTPTLFIHSLNDYRCWMDQSIQMYTALKYLGKEARFILYMEGSHSFRSLARPSIRMRRLRDMLDWFKKYL